MHNQDKYTFCFYFSLCKYWNSFEFCLVSLNSFSSYFSFLVYIYIYIYIYIYFSNGNKSMKFLVFNFFVYLYDKEVNLPTCTYFPWYPNLNKTVNTLKQISMNFNDRTIIELNKFEKRNCLTIYDYFKNTLWIMNNAFKLGGHLSPIVSFFVSMYLP